MELKKYFAQELAKGRELGDIRTDLVSQIDAIAREEEEKHTREQVIKEMKNYINEINLLSPHEIDIVLHSIPNKKLYELIEIVNSLKISCDFFSPSMLDDDKLKEAIETNEWTPADAAKAIVFMLRAWIPKIMTDSTEEELTALAATLQETLAGVFIIASIIDELYIAERHHTPDNSNKAKIDELLSWVESMGF